RASSCLRESSALRCSCARRSSSRLRSSSRWRWLSSLFGGSPRLGPRPCALAVGEDSTDAAVQSPASAITTSSHLLLVCVKRFIAFPRRGEKCELCVENPSSLGHRRGRLRSDSQLQLFEHLQRHRDAAEGRAHLHPLDEIANV